MGRSVARLIVLVLLELSAQAQTAVPTALGLRPEQIPADCKSVDGSFPVDIQTSILWDKPDLYKSLIPLPIAKYAQSFACHDGKGTVFSFQFASNADRERAGAFIKPLLWGESGPTARHPELVLEAGNLLTVVSFRKAPTFLLAALQNVPGSAPIDQNTVAGEGFPISGHGSLHLSVPDDWRTHTRELPEPPSITLHFVPASGDAFDVQVTAVWLDATKRIRETPDAMRADVQRSAEELLPHSVEKTATLHELHGRQSIGFYYALTDNNPGPGEFTNLTQGVFLTGDILSAFTILYRTPTSSEADKALRAFAEATYTK
jgi:hypothetical protein